MGDMGALHDRLHGGLWHTTHPKRFLSIIASGGLRVEPGLPNSERWKAQRPEHYPFVRVLGGISLFDFAGFDPGRYSQTYHCSSWDTFVPHLKKWGVAVWIEIDRAAVADQLISTDELVERWDQTGQRGHTIMPRIEAAHIGDLPMSTFATAFVTWADGLEVREISLSPFDPTSFERSIQEWELAQAREGASQELPPRYATPGMGGSSEIAARLQRAIDRRREK